MKWIASLRVVCLLLVLPFLPGCRQTEVELTSCWKVARVKMRRLEHLVGYPNFRKPTSLKDCFLRIYPDQTAVIWQREAGYSVYKWSYSIKNDAFLLESPESPQGFQFRVARQEGPSAEFAVLNDANRDTGISLMMSVTRAYEDEEMDLLHPNLNAWRIRATRRENPKQLEKRAWGMVNFLVCYFELIERKGQRHFETPILQSPFQFYNRGIGLTRRDQLPEAWASTFYDRQDAERAYDLLVEAFDRDIEYPKNKERLSEAYLIVLKAVRFNLE